MLDSRAAVAVAIILCFNFVGCVREMRGSTQFASRQPEEVCPFQPSKTFDASVRISGSAVFEYRVNGNGVASDEGAVFSVASFASPAMRIFSVELDGRTYAVESGSYGFSGQSEVATQLKAAINSDRSSGLYAYGNGGNFTVTKPNSLIPASIGNLTRVTNQNRNPKAKPIRLAEITVRDANEKIVQCSATDSDGTFSFELPQSTGSYTIEIGSRSPSNRNSAWILNSPNENRHYRLKTTTLSDTDNLNILVRARVHDDELLGGAFNIFDQLLNAQDYLRTTTGSCHIQGSNSYFPGCIPFTAAPRIHVYWMPGFSPAVYVGASGSISFYLRGRREMYIQGGQAGNIVSSDMDHFDNSVILHEYAHFIEDVYGGANSPGGSHNGDSIIDPRLAWSEGWANFFQAAVTGQARYRDTYGSPDCASPCAGAYFDEPLDPSGLPPNDAPALGSLGEGNFREFSITRLLWDVVKPNAGISQFSEIWRAFVSPTGGLRVTHDPFKSVGRFHQIQAELGDLQSWSGIRLAEEQAAGFQFYATPFALSPKGACSKSPISMTPIRFAWDDGSFENSDQYRSNDFYRFDHTGGLVRAELYYSKDASYPPDLDLFVYNSNYVYGRSRDIVMQSAVLGDGCPREPIANGQSSFQGKNGCPLAPPGIPVSFGYESATLDLLPGTYMINVKADTAIRAGSTTNYVILINGNELCPIF
jgi:hypothetical protein